MKMAPLAPATTTDLGHLRVMDGWRCVSILFVLAAPMLLL